MPTKIINNLKYGVEIFFRTPVEVGGIVTLYEDGSGLK